MISFNQIVLISIISLFALVGRDALAQSKGRVRKTSLSLQQLTPKPFKFSEEIFFNSRSTEVLVYGKAGKNWIKYPIELLNPRSSDFSDELIFCQRVNRGCVDNIIFVNGIRSTNKFWPSTDSMEAAIWWKEQFQQFKFDPLEGATSAAER